MPLIAGGSTSTATIVANSTNIRQVMTGGAAEDSANVEMADDTVAAMVHHHSDGGDKMGSSAAPVLPNSTTAAQLMLVEDEVEEAGSNVNMNMIEDTSGDPHLNHHNYDSNMMAVGAAQSVNAEDDQSSQRVPLQGGGGGSCLSGDDAQMASYDQSDLRQGGDVYEDDSDQLQDHFVDDGDHGVGGYMMHSD